MTGVWVEGEQRAVFGYVAASSERTKDREPNIPLARAWLCICRLVGAGFHLLAEAGRLRTCRWLLRGGLGRRGFRRVRRRCELRSLRRSPSLRNPRRLPG